MRLSLYALAACALWACAPGSGTANAQTPSVAPPPQGPQSGQPLAPALEPGQAAANFAGGCFWCMEGPFEAQAGVTEVLSGYTGGTELNPTYEQVGHGATSHTESVRVVYDPTVVTYAQLVEIYWQTMDPTDLGGQFADRGSQYRPSIFVSTPEERAIAEASKAALQASGRFDSPIVVPIVDASDFWVAEDYHQNYYRTHESHYLSYRRGSGRHDFLTEAWGNDIGWH
jgi:methionine-S-sulfoxide reductase